MERPRNVVEKWFHKYYRVLIVNIGDEKLVSVDVYVNKWPFNIDRKECVDGEKYCLLYKIIDDRDDIARFFGDLSSKIVRVEVTGVKARDRYETVNIRYVIRGELCDKEIEELFYKSWRLVGVGAPSVDELP